MSVVEKNAQAPFNCVPVLDVRACNAALARVVAKRPLNLFSHEGRKFDMGLPWQHSFYQKLRSCLVGSYWQHYTKQAGRSTPIMHLSLQVPSKTSGLVGRVHSNEVLRAGVRV